MKLLLASNGDFLIKTGYGLLGIPKEQIKIAYITTASNPIKDRGYVERHIQAMHEQRYSFEAFDVEGKTKEELGNFLANKNVIHVEGGNTCYLLKAIRETSFDEIIKDALARGVVYVGTSAGAYIVCPSIEMTTWKKPEKIKDQFGITDFTGMNLVPFLIKAHYTDDQMEVVKQGMSRSKYPARILRDGQGLFIENGNVQFLGEGEEVML